MLTKEIITKKIKVRLSHEEWENINNVSEVIESFNMLMPDGGSIEVCGVHYGRNFIDECYSFILDLIECYDKTMTIYPEDNQMEGE